MQGAADSVDFQRRGRAARGSEVFFDILMESKMDLTKSELEIMNVLWKAGKPLGRNEIITLSSEERKSWKDSSIHILLNSLLAKDAIVEAGFTRSGKTFGRLYAANISCEDYYADNVFADSSKEVIPSLFSALIKSSEVSPELISELEEMLERRRDELK